MITIVGLSSVVVTAFADLPTEGTVIEGVAIPGEVTLDSTRVEAEAVLGQPLYCQLPNQNFCSYEMGITVVYEDVPSSPDNRIETISWTDSHVQWETTAGATLQLLLDDALTFSDLYPTAEVTGWPEMEGTKVRVYVPELGIDFARTPVTYGPGASASATIFTPIYNSEAETSEDSTPAGAEVPLQVGLSSMEGLQSTHMTGSILVMLLVSVTTSIFLTTRKQ